MNIRLFKRPPCIFHQNQNQFGGDLIQQLIKKDLKKAINLFQNNKGAFFLKKSLGTRELAFILGKDDLANHSQNEIHFCQE